MAAVARRRIRARLRWTVQVSRGPVRRRRCAVHPFRRVRATLDHTTAAVRRRAHRHRVCGSCFRLERTTRLDLIPFSGRSRIRSRQSAHRPAAEHRRSGGLHPAMVLGADDRAPRARIAHWPPRSCDLVLLLPRRIAGHRLHAGVTRWTRWSAALARTGILHAAAAARCCDCAMGSACTGCRASTHAARRPRVRRAADDCRVTCRDRMDDARRTVAASCRSGL